MTGFPSREACVTRYLLEARAKETPSATFLIVDGKETFTYEAFYERARNWGAALAALGVRQGDNVVLWAPNCSASAIACLAVQLIGAVLVPINTHYVGSLLKRALEIAGARVMIAHHALLPNLESLQVGSVASILTIGGPGKPLAGFDLFDETFVAAAGTALPGLERPIEPWDAQAIIFTSGTTGHSKGVICTYAQNWSTTDAHHHVTADDRILISGPIFHATGCSALAATLIRGGSAVMVDRFEAPQFWRVVDEHRVTFAAFLGVTAILLLKKPPSPDDRSHALRQVTIVPFGDDAIMFGERFGVDVFTTFNMTETSCPIYSSANPTVRGSCGRARPGFELRIADAQDRELADGDTGELLIRSSQPWLLSPGYRGNAEASAAAWRNGWFHTGDAFRRDSEGNYFFVDRLKDAIRRRGENISTFEVESEIGLHPDVAEVAVIGVPSELTEDDVLAAIVPRAGATVDPAALIDFLRPRLAHFMIPRYVRIVETLPKTPTNKIQKHILQKEGVGGACWDREAAGVVVARQKLA
jgi:crotonobetaine/carnitine-CoA ligase